MLTVKPDEVKIIPNMRSLFSIDECDTSVGYVLSAGVCSDNGSVCCSSQGRAH